MAHLLLKTEPSEYAFADLQRDKRTTWTGVTNAAAQLHMRAAKKGDTAIIYHTGDEKRCVGLAQLTRDPYADPAAENPKHVTFEIKALRPLKQLVELAAIKGDPQLKDLALVRISRLSVMPVSPEHWSILMQMAGEA